MMQFRILFFILAGFSLNSCATFAQDVSETSGEPFNDAVLIRSKVDNGNFGFCSGVLINSHQILTAAHCIQHNSNFSIYVQGTARRGKTFFGTKAWTHPLYHPEVSLSKYDTGIIELTAEIPEFQGVNYKRFCSSTKHTSKDTRVGFGGRDHFNTKHIFEIEENKYFQKNSQIEFLDEYSVSGDSGGPVYALENDEYCLLGIHSSVSLPPAPAAPTKTYSTFIRNVFTDLLNARPADQVQN